jgi:Na+/citrate or Na+/malate symporter
MDEWAVIVVVGRRFRPRDEILKDLTSVAVILVQIVVLALTLAQIVVGRHHRLREYHACLLCIAHS